MASLLSNEEPLSSSEPMEEDNLMSESSDADSVKLELANKDLVKCISLWKQVFPWMHYEERSNMFMCLTCEWGSIDPKLIMIFQIHSSKDVHLVAKKLKRHKESKLHQKVDKKRSITQKLCQCLYPLLKTFPQYSTSMEEVIGTINGLFRGIFPNTHESVATLAFTGYMCKRIACCIEEDLLNSLAESNYFSIVVYETCEIAVIRWLNEDGESEEHFFCSQISFPGQNMNCISYLQNRCIDLNKLVSFTFLSKSCETATPLMSVISSPVRSPDLAFFIKWIQEAGIMADLFEHLNVLTKLCKTYYHKFALFPEAADLMSIKEPFGYNCILSENIVNFFFDNILVLKQIAGDIHRMTRNMDAYGFSSLEMKNIKTTHRCARVIPKLHKILESLLSENSQSSYKILQKYSNEIWTRLKVLESDSEEYTFLTLIKLFISHVLVSHSTSRRDVIDVLYKKMESLTERDVSLLLPNLLKEHKDLGVSGLFQKFQSLQECTKEKLECETVLENLEFLSSSSELLRKFPEFSNLAEKVKVLPCFPATSEQSVFNIASLEMTLSERVANHLKYPLLLIILEGPECDNLNVDKVMEMWARQWKAGSANKENSNMEKDIVYTI